MRRHERAVEGPGPFLEFFETALDLAGLMIRPGLAERVSRGSALVDPQQRRIQMPSASA